MIGARLKQLRIERNLSQNEVAKAIHLTQQAIDNYEKELREPRGEIVVRFARFYNVTTDYLLGHTDERHGYAPLNLPPNWQQDVMEVTSQAKELGITMDQIREAIEYLMWRQRRDQNKTKGHT